MKSVCLIICLIFCLTRAVQAADQDTSIWMKATSDAPGNLFLENHPAHFKLALARMGKDTTTGTWANVQVDLQVNQVDGTWTESKSMGTFTAAQCRNIEFDLTLPTRGLYKLQIQAKATNGNTGQIDTQLAVVFEPNKTAESSPWGMFLIPYGGKTDKAQADRHAESLRRLGVSWVRLNFWANSWEQVTVESDNPPVVKARFEKWRTIVDSLHERGIHIMATICHVPQELSSQPGVKGPRASDAGPLWARSIPRDLKLWEAFMAEMARQFPEITYWETWNEPNLPHRYWAGSREDFYKLVPHTIAGIKQGNPNAKIVFSGFSSSMHGGENPVPMADAALATGINKMIDVFAAHNMDEQDDVTKQWRPLLQKHGLSDIPMWDTEPKTLIPLRAFSLGISRMFHFLNIAPSNDYGAFDAMLKPDLTPNAAGLTYSTAAYLIGSRPLVAHIDEPTCQVYTFADEQRTTIVLKPTMRGIVDGQVRIHVPSASVSSVKWIDRLGRELPVELKDEHLTAPLDTISFVTANGPLQVVNVQAPHAKPAPKHIIYQMNKATINGPWNANRKAVGWTDDNVVAIWNKSDPADGKPYSIALPMQVSESGTYQLWISADIWTRLQDGNRSISPWRWKMDDGNWHEMTGQPLPLIWREHGPRNEANTPVLDSEVFFLGGGQVLQLLNETSLSSGEHTFTIELTGRRQVPDNAYCIYFDALILRPIDKP